MSPEIARHHDYEFARIVLKHHELWLLSIARGANTEGLTLPMLEELRVRKLISRTSSNLRPWWSEWSGFVRCSASPYARPVASRENDTVELSQLLIRCLTAK
jgi:hypothetical protein